MVTWENATGNGGASNGGEGRGGRWGGGMRATKPNNDDDKIIALAPLAIKVITINQDGGRV